MTLLDVLRHQWRERWRSSVRGRSLLATLLYITAAGYFGLLLVGLGWFYPEVVAEMAPRRDPLHLLNQYILIGLTALLGARFFLQRSVRSDVQAYLSLPIRHSHLVRLVQITSALSLFNALPLLVIAVLWGSTVLPSTSMVGAVCWASGGLLGVAATQFANSLLRTAWDWNAGVVVSGVLGLGVAGAWLSWLGKGARSASVWLFSGLVSGKKLPLFVVVMVTVSLTMAAHRVLQERLYGVLETPAQHSDTSGYIVSRELMQGWGPVALFAFLDTKLILRNKQPRQVLIAQLPLFGVLAWQLLLSSPEETRSTGFIFIYCFILSGQLGFAYHGFSYAWHGRHFDGLMVRPHSLQTLVRGHYTTFAGLCVGQSAFLLLFAALTQPYLISPLSSMLLYHLGITAPLLLTGCVWAREAVRLNQGKMYKYEGNTTTYFATTGLGTVILMGIPAGLAFWKESTLVTWVIATLGAFGTAMVPSWTRGIGTLLRLHRYAMLDGFREKK